MIFGFFLVDKICDTDSFVNIEPHLHPRDETHLVMMDNPFDVLLNSINKDLVENFGIHMHQGNGSIILFLMGSLPGLGIKVILAS